MNRKRGSIEIFILAMIIIFTCIILSAIFLLYIQINSVIYSIKSDLFYIAQNGYIAADYKELAYSNYKIDNKILEEKITELIRLNHPNYKIDINNIAYNQSTNNIIMDIDLVIEPIVLRKIIGDITLNIRENVKLKLMEVK